MNIPTIDGYSLTDARTELEGSIADLARLQRMQDGTEPNTLGGWCPELRLEEAMDITKEQRDYYFDLIARLERGERD